MIPKNNTVSELDYIKNIDETYFSKALRNTIINNKKIKSLYLNVKTNRNKKCFWILYNNLIIDIRNKNISSFTKEELHQFYIDLYQFMCEFKQLLIMNKKIVQINTSIVFVYQHDFKRNLQEYINFLINNTEDNDYVVNFLNQIYMNETL